VVSLFFPRIPYFNLDFLICRPWKFAALGPGPFGPCVNTALNVAMGAGADIEISLSGYIRKCIPSSYRTLYYIHSGVLQPKTVICSHCNHTPRTHRGTTTEDEVGISQHKTLHPYYDGLPCPTALWTTINSTYPTNVVSNN
jgi:hypothetical protein